MTNGSIVAPQQRSVLISGIGVAGPALAYWLTLYGFKTTLVEKAAHLRTGGYVVDFLGRGFDVAEKMGIVPSLKREGYDIKELRLVGASGRRVYGELPRVESTFRDDNLIPSDDLPSRLDMRCAEIHPESRDLSAHISQPAFCREGRESKSRDASIPADIRKKRYCAHIKSF